MNDSDIHDMNRRIQMGWEPSRHQWQVVADRCKDMPEMRAAKIWGIHKRRHYVVAPRGNSPVVMDVHQIVANPQFAHPMSIVAQGLTYEEAEALIKILES